MNRLERLYVSVIVSVTIAFLLGAVSALGFGVFIVVSHWLQASGLVAALAALIVTLAAVAGVATYYEME